MDSAKATQLIEQLGENVSGLKEALEPLLGGDLNETANKLPVLDRAKLYIFVTYTIESILFSNLRLQGVEAKNHPVFTELTRVRQYFEKIKAAEQGEQKPSMKLDKGAAGRMVKHDLAKMSSKGTKRRFNEDGPESQAAKATHAQSETNGQQVETPEVAPSKRASSKKQKSRSGK